MAEQDKPIFRFDPVRATEANALGSAHELVLIFKRAVFSETPKGVVAEGIPSASVAMTWALAKALRRALDTVITEYEKKNGPIKEVDGAAAKLLH